MFGSQKETRGLFEMAFFIEFCATLLVLTLVAGRYPSAVDADAMKSILSMVIGVTTELLGVFIAVVLILMAIPKRPEFTALIRASQVAKTGFSLTVSLITAAAVYIGLCIEPVDKSKEFLLAVEFIFIYALISFATLVYGCLRGLSVEMARKC